MSNVLSVDIGGSKVIVACVDEFGCIIKSEKQILPKHYDAKYLTDLICKMMIPFLDFNPVAVGIAVPGLTDSKTGEWKYAPFSGIESLPITDIISKHTGLPCFAENDVNICAIGEKDYGVCKSENDFLWVTVSNGVGGALFLNNELYTGKYGNAGEIGHFYVGDKSYVCGCGKKGCLETFASGQALRREYLRLTGENTSADIIAERAKNGEKIAVSVFKRAGTALGKSFGYAINLLNIDKIVIGGGVAQSLYLLMPYIKKAINKYVFYQANKNVVIERTGLGYYASIIGAAAFARRNIK